MWGSRARLCCVCAVRVGRCVALLFSFSPTKAKRERRSASFPARGARIFCASPFLSPAPVSTPCPPRVCTHLPPRCLCGNSNAFAQRHSFFRAATIQPTMPDDPPHDVRLTTPEIVAVVPYEDLFSDFNTKQFRCVKEKGARCFLFVLLPRPAQPSSPSPHTHSYTDVAKSQADDLKELTTLRGMACGKRSSLATGTLDEEGEPAEDYDEHARWVSDVCCCVCGVCAVCCVVCVVCGVCSSVREQRIASRGCLVCVFAQNQKTQPPPTTPHPFTHTSSSNTWTPCTILKPSTWPTPPPATCRAGAC